VAASALAVTVGPDSVRVGERFEVALQRTLRVPEDGETYPLPPGLGRLPLLISATAGGRLPTGDVIAPLHQREAVWLAFGGTSWKPNAVQVGVGRINAVSGEPWAEGLRGDPQDYLVTPDQPWLDGINAGHGTVRQFVALPLGTGATIEAQLTGEESEAALTVRVFEPRPGRFPDEPPPPQPGRVARMGSMGLGAGGAISQKLYPDRYGIDTWDPEQTATVHIRLLNSETWTELTGRPVPPTPISAQTYAAHGLPWFSLYDESRGDIAPSERFAGLHGTADEPEPGARIDPGSIRGIDREGRG
jgi:hypothetical protein